MLAEADKQRQGGASRAAAPRERYGEAVVRELLGANFIGEHSLASAPAPASAEGASPSEAPGATPADPAGS